MASDYRIISGGTILYLVNSGGVPTPGGAATAAATTPWAIRLEEWTPQAAPPSPIWSGGPPFADGRALISQSYDAVTETIPLILVGSTHDTLVARLQQLRRLATAALFATPALLLCQPSGATSPVYFEILSANVQERRALNSLSVAEGYPTVWVDLTIVRRPFGGRLTSGETLLSAVTFGNTGTGSPDNVEAYSTGAGDLIYEGQPLNLSIGLDATTRDSIYLASVLSRTYSTTNAGTYTTSFTDGGVVVGTFISGMSAAAFLTNPALRLRALVRASAASSNVQLRYKVRFGTGSAYFWAGSWVTPDPAGVATVMDLGGADIASLIRRSRGATAPVLDVVLFHRSTDGAATSVTVTYTEALLYYDFCKVVLDDTPSNTDTLLVDSFAEQSGAACLPHLTPRAYRLNSSGVQQNHYVIRGTAPRYWSGASLYVASIKAAGHTTADTLTVTATHAPLYRTFRGNG